MEQEASRNPRNASGKVPFKLPPRVRAFGYGFCIFMVLLAAKFFYDGFIHPSNRSHEVTSTLLACSGSMLLSAAIIAIVALAPDYIGSVPNWLLKVWGRDEWEKSAYTYWLAEEKIFRGNKQS